VEYLCSYCVIYIFFWACPLIILVLVSIKVWNTAVSTFYFMCIIVVSINYMHLYLIHVLKIVGGMVRDWGEAGQDEGGAWMVC
jgi:hypothetical protein